jgi:predicted negative regulator of RcsB-dependent stress response
MQFTNRFWIGLYSFTAFIMAVAVGVFSWLAWQSHQEAGLGRTANAPPQTSGPIPDERYELLAAFPAPAYVHALPEPREFKKAIERYSQGDYSGAVPGLRAATEAQPDFTAARFYLSICLLLTNNRISGIEELRAVTEAGDSPYLERARFYLAKGLIAEHDIKRAQQQLEQAIAQHGDLEKQSKALLSQIRPNP